jgi:hypothetical protein
MSRFNFSHFGNFPILARIFWKVPKYLPDIPERQTFNKIIGIYHPEFKATCYFTHKTDIIKSDFVFMSDKFRIEESCKYTKEKFQISYSFIEKLQEEQIFIFERNIGSFPQNIQQTMKKIEEILEENKDKCIIS